MIENISKENIDLEPATKLTPNPKLLSKEIKCANNETYELNIYLSENNIKLEIIEKNDVLKHIYSIELTFEQFIEKDNYFRIFDDLPSIFDLINDLSLEEIDIKKEDFKVILILKITERKKLHEINFLLIEEKSDNKKDFKKLSEKVKEIDLLKTENKELKNEILNLKNENISFRNEINELKNKFDNILNEKAKEIEYLKKENQETKNENINLNNKIISIDNSLQDFKKSTEFNLIYNMIDLSFYEKLNNNIFDSIGHDIIQNKCDLALISIGIMHQLQKKIDSMTLLYKASVDGEHPKYFHAKCDDKENTLTVVKSSQGKNRFGGFTTKEWKSTNLLERGFFFSSPKPIGEFSKDSKSFIFSFKNKKNYYITKYENAIYNFLEYGPSFGKMNFLIRFGGPETGLYSEEESGQYFYEEKISDGHYHLKFKTQGSYENDSIGNKNFLGANSGISDYEVYQLTFK